jgi:hypothetical protein
VHPVHSIFFIIFTLLLFIGHQIRCASWTINDFMILLCQLCIIVFFLFCLCAFWAFETNKYVHTASVQLPMHLWQDLGFHISLFTLHFDLLPLLDELTPTPTSFTHVLQIHDDRAAHLDGEPVILGVWFSRIYFKLYHIKYFHIN